MTDSILVTGAAGYIGSHTCRVLMDLGLEVIGLDNLSTGFEEALPTDLTFYKGNAGDQALVRKIVQQHSIKEVIHFAGSVINSESIQMPAAYYENNSVATLRLVQACNESEVERFLYSSSAGVYGESSHDLLDESMPCAPVTPYGASKHISERFISDVAATGNLRFACLRYFNVVGADIARGNGQRSKVSTHLLKIVCEALTGKRESVAVYGNDYDTADGTCIRDYVHVLDLVDAHIAALQYLKQDIPQGDCGIIMNCGYGHGYSVREVINAAFEVAGCSVDVTDSPRRVGDPARLVAANSKIQSLTNWRPQRDDLHTIIESALVWEKNLV